MLGGSADVPQTASQLLPLRMGVGGAWEAQSRQIGATGKNSPTRASDDTTT
jgi:hypothetical protein